MTNFFNLFIEKRIELFTLILEHIQLTLIAVLISIAIAVPLGIFISKNKKLATLTIGFANLIQAIPSLAILGFLIPFLGIGSTPAIFMVVLYSMLPILKNTYTAIINISPAMIESAKGIGMTPQQILMKIKLPLAIPVIMAGIRISAVTSVGLMTIAAFIGAGGLGYLVFSGIQTVNSNLILLGAIPAALLALLMDYFVGRVEEWVTPNGISQNPSGESKRKLSPLKKKIIISLATLCILTTLGFQTLKFLTKTDSITIASKNFSEQLILGHIYADLIEDQTDLKVNKKLNLGGTGIIFDAMKAKEVDLYVDYTGTLLQNILGIQSSTDTPEAVYETVKNNLNDLYQIEVLSPLGFNNTYTLAVTKETAILYNLVTISDLAQHSNNLIATPTIEFSNRTDGLPGVIETYNMEFKTIKPIDGALRYTSIINNESQVIDAFSTDGLISEFDLVVLEDDKNFFPGYVAVPLIRQETLTKYPQLVDVLNQLTNVLTDEIMRELNYRVDVNQEDPAKVAESFLRETHLIN